MMGKPFCCSTLFTKYYTYIAYCVSEILSIWYFMLVNIIQKLYNSNIEITQRP